MKTLLLLMSLGVFLMLPACSELSLEDEIEGEEGGNVDHGAAADTLSVRDLTDVEVGKEVVLKAYIVGYVSGSAMSGAVFGLPQSANTNVIVADSLHPGSYRYCAPVQLVKDTKWREQLNLCEHPEWLGAYVAVRGTCDTYFRVAGIKNLTSVKRLADVPADSTATDTPEKDGLVLPTLSGGPAQVFEGT